MLRKGHAAAKFLGLYFIVFGIRVILSYTVTDGRILQYPHLFRVLSPFHFLFGPLSYLFLYYVLRPTKNFTRWQYLHFLPFIIHAVELAPFYFGPLELKIQEIQNVLDANSLVNYTSLAGVIPTHLVNKFKFISFGTYCILGVILLVKFVSQNTKAYRNNMLILNWLFADSVIRFVSLGAIFAYGSGQIGSNNLKFSYADLFMHLDASFNLVFVFLYPYLFDGQRFRKLVMRLTEHESNPESGETIQNLQKYQQIATDLERLFENECPFLNPELVQEIIAKRLQISVRELTSTINFMFGLSFPDFVNGWRIQYLVDKRNTNKSWRKYSLEELSELGGFGSRQSLNNAVNHLYHMSSAKYFQMKDKR